MSAGYIIYSLDWDKFRNLVERPSKQQLAALGKLLRDGLDEHDGEFEDGNPILEWPNDAKALAQIAAQRLPLLDWYGDLSASGRNLWEGVVFNACMNCDGIDVGFRVDNDGIYWDVIEVAWKQLGVVPNTISDVALSAFSTRPFRYHQRPKPGKSRDEYDRGEDDRRASLLALQGALGRFLDSAKQGRKDVSQEKLLDKLEGLEGVSPTHKNAIKELLSDEEPADAEDDGASEDWSPMHSMHTPDEVKKMQAELKSVEAALKATKKGDARKEYKEDLMPAIETVARDGRMLFIQVDT